MLEHKFPCFIHCLRAFSGLLTFAEHWRNILATFKNSPIKITSYIYYLLTLACFCTYFVLLMKVFFRKFCCILYAITVNLSVTIASLWWKYLRVIWLKVFLTVLPTQTVCSQRDTAVIQSTSWNLSVSDQTLSSPEFSLVTLCWFYSEVVMLWCRFWPEKLTHCKALMKPSGSFKILNWPWATSCRGRQEILHYNRGYRSQSEQSREES